MEVLSREYLATVFDPDCEYVGGEILLRHAADLKHSALQGILTAWLFEQRKALGLQVFPETRTQVAPDRYRVPDISVTLTKPSGRILRQPPFLCIEILSPEDRASRVEEKIDDYLRFGVPNIWLIDPRRKVAWSYTHEGKREAANVLTTNKPDLALDVRELFAELENEVLDSD